MSETNGHVPNSQRLCYTPVRLLWECDLKCKSGRGLASFVRDAVWPGIPAVGQQVDQSEAPWTISAPTKIREINVDLDRPERVTLILEEGDWGVTHRRSAEKGEESPDLDYFLECIEYMIEAGWTLSPTARWFPYAEDQIKNFTMKDFAEEGEQ